MMTILDVGMGVPREGVGGRESVAVLDERVSIPRQGTGREVADEALDETDVGLELREEVLLLDEVQPGDVLPEVRELVAQVVARRAPLGEARAQGGEGLGDRDEREVGEGGGELAELGARGHEHVDGPLAGGPAAGVGRGVDGPFGTGGLALDGVPGDEPVAFEAVDRLVELGALTHVDHAVLAALPDELLHAVRVHRLLDGECEHREGEAGPLGHGVEATSVSDTKTRPAPPDPSGTAGRAAGPPAAGPGMVTSQSMPKRSVHIPNSSPHICFSSAIVTVPLSLSC